MTLAVSHLDRSAVPATPPGPCRVYLLTDPIGRRVRFARAFA